MFLENVAIIVNAVPSSPGRYTFFVLNEYFFELNTGKNPVLNNIFELNFFGNSKMNIF